MNYSPPLPCLVNGGEFDMMSVEWILFLLDLIRLIISLIILIKY